jgi:putative two-component system response regulator
MGNKILIVEDSVVDVALIKAILSDQDLYFAKDGVEAFEVIDQIPDIDLMILDINMPRMNGFEVLEIMRNNPKYAKIVTLILTNHDELENEIKGLSLGAVDYIRKPLNIESLRKRIDIHSRLKQATKLLEENNSILEETIKERTSEIALTRSITIHALIGLLEIRDIESGNHTIRTQYFIKAICEELAKKERYKDILTEEYIREIFDTAPLHDIGKVGVPDNILLKPGKLTPEEYEKMKLHVIYGVNAIMVDSHLAVPSFIKTASEIIGGHHEQFNGNGYPNGLKGEEIPLSARLMAFADVYDALINKRVYKEAFSHEVAMNMILERSGTQFDPEIVEAFVACEGRIIEIAEQYKAQE